MRRCYIFQSTRSSEAVCVPPSPQLRRLRIVYIPASHRIVMKLLQATPFLLLLLLPAVTPQQDDEGPVVKVSGGEILGRVVSQPGAQLTKYYSFEGIPYARPPLGDRRFKDPEEVESWSGVRNATAPGSKCVQKDVIFTNMTIGDEDCLFINVFTADPPESWLEVKRPVVVYIHGGAFILGSGEMERMRPDSILRQEVVLVSFNYRLGVLGFLNTEDKEAPGNAGLKDAVLALRWIQNNIKTFGGNPEQVTAFGESAGAAMVQYLLLTPITKGLLHGAVAMSGDALCRWAQARHPRQNSLALRQLHAAACPDDTPDAIAPCLRRVDAKTLVTSQDQVPPPELLHHIWKNPFLPSVEAPGSSETPFLSAEPDQLLREGNFLKVPFITGFTSAEGILYIRFAGLISNPSLWSSVDEQFVDKFRWEMPLGVQGADAINEVRAFYMGDRAIRDAGQDPEALRRFVQLTTDMLFATCSVSSARLMAEAGAPVWVYEFTHESPNPSIKQFLYNASHVPGVAHGEDLTYLFNVAPITDSPSEDAIRQRRVRLFMDFAKTGNPTPNGTELPTAQWPPYTVEKETYMEMGTEFTIKDHVLGDRIALWRKLAKSEDSSSINERPVVHLKEGALRGRKAVSAAGCSYYSFQGIPYAQPPVGPLRFKDSLPATSWHGIRDALQEGSLCPQGQDDNIKGHENCLFINVYTSRISSVLEDGQPVLVWIHGGGFEAGSGNVDELGPDYLVCEDIIVVTLNYRLGPLGFLYLDEAAPGNAGLKDQVQALRWVQKNIAAFGGDPHKVTIMGESAGGASVHLQMLSPLTKGLFRGVIAQSGTAVAPWSLQKTPAISARRLASSVNCTASDSHAIVECLRGVPAKELVAAARAKTVLVLDDLRPVFVPAIEQPVPGVETFLPESPFKLIRKRTSVSLLIGCNTREALLYLGVEDFRNETIAEKWDNAWEKQIFPDLRLSGNAKKEEVLTVLREFYMDGKPLNNNTLLGYLDMIGDISFVEPAIYTIQHMVQDSGAAVYVYSFSVEDELNMLKTFMNLGDLPGACHADELGYIFRVPGLPEVHQNSSAALIRRRMVRLWTNFVKTGEPTPQEDPLLGVHWKAYKKDEHNSVDIGSDLTPRSNFYPKKMNFWNEFHDTFGDTYYSPIYELLNAWCWYMYRLVSTPIFFCPPS